MVAGVTIVTDDVGPEGSSVEAAVMEDERIWTAVQDVVDTDDGDVLAAVVMVFDTLQFVPDGAPPAV